MDERLVYGNVFIGGYQVVGYPVWESLPNDNLFGEGPYVKGDRCGKVLAINCEERPDATGLYKCVIIKIKISDWRLFKWRICIDPARDMEVIEEIPTDEFFGSSIEILVDPRERDSVIVRGECSEAALAKINSFLKSGDELGRGDIKFSFER